MGGVGVIAGLLQVGGDTVRLGDEEAEAVMGQREDFFFWDAEGDEALTVFEEAAIFGGAVFTGPGGIVVAVIAGHGVLLYWVVWRGKWRPQRESNSCYQDENLMS